MDQQSPRKNTQASYMSTYYSNFMDTFNKATKSKSEWTDKVKINKKLTSNFCFEFIFS